MTPSGSLVNVGGSNGAVRSAPCKTAVPVAGAGDVTAAEGGKMATFVPRRPRKASSETVTVAPAGAR